MPTVMPIGMGMMGIAPMPMAPMGMMPVGSMGMTPMGMMPMVVPGMPLSQAANLINKPPEQAEPSEKPKLVLDPDVQELVDHFDIESDVAGRLNTAMGKRYDSRESDMAKLWELLEDVGCPSSLLNLQVNDMESGEFVGKIKSHRE